MSQQPRLRFRRSRILMMVALYIPATALSLVSLGGRLGLFWQIVQLVLMGTGAVIMLRENKRAKAASRQEPPVG